MGRDPQVVAADRLAALLQQGAQHAIVFRGRFRQGNGGYRGNEFLDCGTRRDLGLLFPEEQ